MHLGVLQLPASPIVMGVLELAPGFKLHDALLRGEEILLAGASLLDISAEESNLDDPDQIPKIEELITSLTERIGIPLSISTSNPDIMKAAVKAGASMINDMRALTMPGALVQAAELRVPVVVMHMQNDPVIKQVAATNDDVVAEVYKYLEQRIAACEEVGIDRNKIIIDPGFGFGKSLAHNLCLLRSLDKFRALNCPIMVGLSRKSMIGQIIDAPPEERAFGSVTAAAIAIGNGANIVRAYEVKGTADAIKVIKAVLSS